MNIPMVNRAWATRRRTRAMIVLLLLLAAAAAWEVQGLWRDQAWNRWIAAGELPAEAVPRLGALPEALRFTHAQALAKRGERDAALKLYRALQADTPIGQRARYNAANLLMQQAIEVRAGQQPGQAVPLIELAKEIYREVLREDPKAWDARYNLERAQRLLPDPDDEDNAPAGAPEAAERAATTMRGVSPGLP